MPAGVDLGRFLSARGRSEIRKRHGLEAGDLVLFFMGWVYPFSGLLEVAEGLLAREGREERARLLVVGRGNSWGELAQLAARRDQEDLIKMVDFRPYAEVPSYLASADVCLLPAHNVRLMRNIVPIKVYEYLAAGKPVIATKLPGLQREFGEGHGVVYVDGPDQVVATAARLRREGALRRLGEQGRAFVLKNGWNSISDAFESDLAALLRARSRNS